MCRKVISDIRSKYGNILAENASDIKTAAAMLLNELDYDSSEKYPLPVVQLLKELGFDLFRGSFKNPNQSGLIAVDSSLPEQNKHFKTDRIVLVNREDSTAHQRFTIAHEIAHYIFDFDETTQPTYSKAYLTTETEDEIELRANRFAAELLMPEDDFVNKFKEFKLEQGDSFSLSTTITQLRKYFDVPATAVKRRLDETGCIKSQQGA